jgi:hypothetical protein
MAAAVLTPLPYFVLGPGRERHRVSAYTMAAVRLVAIIPAVGRTRDTADRATVISPQYGQGGDAKLVDLKRLLQHLAPDLAWDPREVASRARQTGRPSTAHAGTGYEPSPQVNQVLQQVLEGKLCQAAAAPRQAG